MISGDNFVHNTIAGSETDADFALRVIDNSMIKAGIMSGDVVFVKSTTKASDKDIVALWEGGDNKEVVLKRIYFKSDDQILVMSSDPDIPPMFYSRKDPEQLPLLGVVVALYREFNHG